LDPIRQLKTKLNFEANDIGLYMVGSGLATMAGGILGKISIGKLGALNHTSLAHLFAILNFHFWGIASSWPHVAIALLMGALGDQKSNSIKAGLTTTAAAAGIGRGQIAAGISNMANLTKIMGPYAYTLLFGQFGQYSPFFVGSLFIVLSEVLQRQVPWSALNGSNEQKKQDAAKSKGEKTA
jgi:predicted MFS family arabinose efflux permease